MDIQKLLEGGGMIAVASISLFFATTFLKMYRQQVASHIKTLKLIARLPVSDDETLVHRPAPAESSD